MFVNFVTKITQGSKYSRKFICKRDLNNTYIKNVLLDDCMHDNANKEVEEDGGNVLQTVRVTYYVWDFWCEALDTRRHIMVNRDEHVRKR